MLETPDRQLLLKLARECITARLEERDPVLPAPVPAVLTRCGAFVTLHAVSGKTRALRGCIGHIVPQRPLYVAVLENARNAALRDPRFDPVQPAELPGIEIEVSVLTEPRPLAYASPDELLGKLRPGIDGVVLHLEGRMATFLPQVWEQIPDKTQFLSQLSVKAGCEPDAWREPSTCVSLYQVEPFSEPPVVP